MEQIVYILETTTLFQEKTISDKKECTADNNNNENSNNERINILHKLISIDLANISASIDILIYSVQYIQTYTLQEIYRILYSEFKFESKDDIEKQLIYYMLGRIYIMRKSSIFAIIRPTFNDYNTKELMRIISDFANKLYRILLISVNSGISAKL